MLAREACIATRIAKSLTRGDVDNIYVTKIKVIKFK